MNTAFLGSGKGHTDPCAGGVIDSSPPSRQRIGTPPLGFGVGTCLEMTALILILVELLFATADATAPRPADRVAERTDAATEAYFRCCLTDVMEIGAFAPAYQRCMAADPGTRYMAIADMTRPSTEERFEIVDLQNGDVVLRTWVAHGQGSGELMATAFSNRNGSHQTSLGLYRVGSEIISPKHGAALLLHGLDKGVNCLALEREIIMHGADYVSRAFIDEHGRLGRSWGCPALPREHMDRAIDLLANGGLLYVHGN